MSATTIATTTTTLASTKLIGGLPTMTGSMAITAGSYCSACGQDMPQHCHDQAQEAQQQIQELEFQITRLTTRAMKTAEQLANYENEIVKLRRQAKNNSSVSSTASSARSNSLDKSISPSSSGSPTSQPSGGRLSTIASFLPYRRSSANPPAPCVPPQNASAVLESTLELQNALNREQSLRKAAETQLSQTNLELEELTASLFSQANEMVAQERKARAKLEERVALLERRDVEKRKRLDRLEKALQRVERVRALVG
ncbi:hypothetical protein ASPZODRAFT_127250 [Penicilliopsis zonata CBS 506.65]|uniref:GDP/GTP exchange factor Sec2 N-terminal domain-containing protein n=1 Tax=Penicilliopsis zonata CBS 506.65 TaxID=1073090 RepID=A0A1L9SVH1_9EURO|nr:hypothetical protein ASPZODRAFT_127250 [Penicilliopsis zonata CBS 506.65]OJJ51222.1 hypothetical protein ASPZODRAFT_127250 [Penicilliopsis zonata CBS 506.65]